MIYDMLLTQLYIVPKCNTNIILLDCTSYIYIYIYISIKNVIFRYSFLEIHIDTHPHTHTHTHTYIYIYIVVIFIVIVIFIGGVLSFHQRFSSKRIIKAFGNIDPSENL